MTATELIQQFTKGHNMAGRLSIKQVNWLISLAKQEGLFDDSGCDMQIKMPDGKRWVMKQGSRLASGGSYVGSKPTGTYSLRLYYLIKFNDTGITEFRNSDDVERIRSEKYEFEIVL